jgi:hypothetical protein|tara:strand:+ start:161 stop:805 length:645 start_codon:yes stop_codon:yes gene_type:complete
MVRASTLLTLGLIGAGLLAFTSLGGASGIGQRIGGGFKAFSDSLTGGFTGVSDSLTGGFTDVFQGGAPTSQPVKYDLQLSDNPSDYYDPKTIEKNLQDVLPVPYEPTVPGGAVDTAPLPQATPIETTEEPKVIVGVPNQGEKAFFSPPKPSNYLERITQYVAQPLTVLTPSQAAKQNVSRAKQDYGGYGSPNKQNQTLQNLLAANAQKYGEYFS